MQKFVALVLLCLTFSEFKLGLSLQGNMGTLDIAMPGGRGSHGAMRYSELDNEDAGEIVESKRAYEKRIGSLMGEVGALKSEVGTTLSATELTLLCFGCYRSFV